MLAATAVVALDNDAFNRCLKELLLRTNLSDVARLQSTLLRIYQPLEFTYRELAMLELLMARQGCQVTRDEFLDRFWPPETYPTNRTVDTLVLSIRKKLGAGKGIRIETAHRAGYRLAAGK